MKCVTSTLKNDLWKDFIENDTDEYIGQRGRFNNSKKHGTLCYPGCEISNEGFSLANYKDKQIYITGGFMKSSR